MITPHVRVIIVLGKWRRQMKMKITLVLLLTSVCVSIAQAAPASEASINELLKVMNAQLLIDNMLPQMEGMAKSMVQQSTKNATPSPEQQAKIDKMLTQMFKIYTDEFTWAKLQPMYVRIYQASFSQEEVDGMLVFYRSPIGQSAIKKMPLVMQNSMLEVQQMIGPITQKMQALARDMATEQAKSQKPEPAPKKD
jgi:hypothetical protein